MTSYRDYLWLDRRYDFWTENGYCATLIRGLSPDGVLEALDAVPDPDRAVVDGLEAVSFASDDLERWREVSYPENQVVAVTDIGDGWTLLVQQNSGYVGISGELMAPIIANHEVVAHYRSINADSRFTWWRGGQERISFDTLLPGFDLGEDNRWEPEIYATIMTLIANVGGIEFDDSGTREEFHHTQGAYALAEALTGIRITQDIFDHQTFTVAVVSTTPITQRTPHPPTTEDSAAPGTWGQLMRQHRKARTLSIHAGFRKTQGQHDQFEVEFWHKPPGLWRIHDTEGVLVISNRRETWARRGGTLHRNIGVGLPAFPESLIDLAGQWDEPLKTLLPAATAGEPVTVAGRPAWEFTPPPGWTRIDARVAFDAETGIAMRWSSDHWTLELTSLELPAELPDELFEGPR